MVPKRMIAAVVLVAAILAAAAPYVKEYRVWRPRGLYRNPQ